MYLLRYDFYIDECVLMTMMTMTMIERNLFIIFFIYMQFNELFKAFDSTLGERESFLASLGFQRPRTIFCSPASLTITTHDSFNRIAQSA